MIKLVVTDMDGAFLDSKGDFNQSLYEKVKNSKALSILGDSATRIKHNGEYIYMNLFYLIL